MGSVYIQIRNINNTTTTNRWINCNEELNFGWAHKISEPGVSSVRTTADKYLFVSAPGHDNDTGRVYMYDWVLEQMDRPTIDGHRTTQ